MAALSCSGDAGEGVKAKGEGDGANKEVTLTKLGRIPFLILSPAYSETGEKSAHPVVFLFARRCSAL